MTDRYFIALLPPPDLQAQVNQIKQEFGERFQSWAAQKSPPHITLQAPFNWIPAEQARLASFLAAFSQSRSAFPITLIDFGAFPPRVIYIQVDKTPPLLALQAELAHAMAETWQICDPKAKHRPFAPHMTVAFRDLTREQFRAAWSEFQQRSFASQFVATHLTLLQHNGQRWLAVDQFPLQDQC